MKNLRSILATLALAVGLLVAPALSGASAVAPSAQADTGVDVFLRALADRGVVGVDPARAVEVGQSICPRLVEPGQAAANVAADVAEAIGRPLGPATVFTGVAISVFCPGAVAALASGQSPIPLDLLGI
ncbi:DUF732 domain-containing protein [Mycolicibacterium thermoresistibile]|jgi:hypothetical protein|uniref:DUF732 domain-containing protein n=2 Tax=Mycolicibacterium thermoresistibile TaxID=1797 RepID=G7CER2_MYCT3|nr:DUF732 domain-containing protein [Mycolicibacterium thermoresistibile]EHI12991.1 hypothetical protein KEK_07397 [Mycolicibacterium thermoresistibile ATCC 19527]MCV7190377.1 DUF732 domain-containing protein [Mycolicibacterium thermoresistibile]GAT15849.1 protein of unknown function [Mycolicibacterium thermoresistibile]SNW19512.1 Protein of uncharacterised function (DUF732) [Mycolicibacterium thermoresistibile]